MPTGPSLTPMAAFQVFWSTTSFSVAPRTLVEFRLQPEGDGTRLQIVESGFDALPEPLRTSALRSNTEGWTIQIDNVRRHAED